MAQKRPKKNFWGANFKSARDFLQNEPHIVYVAVLAFIGNFWLFFGFFQNKHLEALKKKFSYIIYTLLYKKIFFSDQNCQSVKKFTYWVKFDRSITRHQTTFAGWIFDMLFLFPFRSKWRVSVIHTGFRKKVHFWSQKVAKKAKYGHHVIKSPWQIE